MVYVTMKMPPMYRQMSIEELIFGEVGRTGMINANTSNTRTDYFGELPERFQRIARVERLIKILSEFNVTTEPLRAVKREQLYHTFFIEKSSGRGYRRIDAPQPELMSALRMLKQIFEKEFNALYHTSAFAYVRHRSTVDAVKRHQANNSKWFGKFDLSNFFGSTTLDFVMRQFSMIFPFSEVVKVPKGRDELEKALELAFLNGGLPQGTPISPIITNIMMIPIDFQLANTFRDFNKQSFVYTRYADDFIVSSKYHFDCRTVQQYIVDVLKGYDAPFTINASKTRYGSSSGRNFNLGIVLTKENRMTIGREKKRKFQAMLCNYVLDRQNGNPWPLEDVRVLDGYRNYYRMIEGETIDEIVSHVSKKYGEDIVKLIKEDLRT